MRETVHYFDDFGGVRQHPGNDLMGAKLDHELAANDGTITFVRADSSGHSGNMLVLTGTDGWRYWYIHINNDTPGTDDGKNPAQWRFAPGIVDGAHVKRGQFIAYMGDSGQAETTDPHLHFELHRPNDTFIDPYTSLRLAQGAGANGLCSFPTNPAPHPSPAAGRGFWTLGTDGKVLGFGNVQTFATPAKSATPKIPLPKGAVAPANVALASTPTGNGYWIVDAAGNVVPFGDAVAYGGTGSIRLNAPIIGVASTPSGHGYWLLARDGGIFGYGDAHFYGSTGSLKLNSPIISMSATPGGHGYWLLGGDGGIFGYGDAHFYGSTGSVKLKAPVVSMSATTTGHGYWLLARDGGLFGYGDAHFYGSMPGTGWCGIAPALTIARTSTAAGYWILLADGQVVAFGDAKAWGQPATTHARAIALAAAP